jgi:hypothetical protein
MSVYQVQKLLFNLHNDLELKEKYKESPEEILKRYDLADSELKPLLEPVGSLYRMRTHTYLLWAYGISLATLPSWLRGPPQPAIRR